MRLVSDREALEIEEVRVALERCWPPRRDSSRRRRGPAELSQMLDEMRRRWRRATPLGYSELNAAFHELIWASAGQNATASRLVANLKSQSIRFQYHTILRPGRPERSLREHEAIYAAIAAHDGDAAEAAMLAHLDEVLETLRWAIDHQPRSPRWSAS